MKPNIHPLGNHSFQLFWPELIMTITFKYLINQHKIESPFVIQHYQGKPVGQRYFGYYDGTQYISAEAGEVTHETLCQTIAITDSDIIRPCAVNLFQNSILKQIDHGSYIVVKATPIP
jgi:hypothetical protein